MTSASTFGRLVRGLILIAMVTVLVLPGTVFAQLEKANLAGNVKDPSGAALAKAKVEAVSTATGAVRTATTDSTGRYTIPSLAPGLYDVKIDAKGFAPAAQKVQIAPGVPATADFQMAVAGSSTEVEVTAAAEVQVEMESSSLSQVVTARRVSELPSLTRDPYDFVQTLGNVQQDSASGTGGRDQIVRGAGVSIAGQRSSGVDVLLDGMENIDMYTTTVGQPVPQDAVDTFSVTTSNFSAEYGRASGGVLNVVTKSGTNKLHGSLYEFNRVSALTANDYDDNALGNPKAKYTRNQFGYSVGGPVIKDKLFFFSSTEWLRVRSQANTTAVIADPAFLAGAAPATQAFFSGQTLRPGLTCIHGMSASLTTATGTATCQKTSALGYGDYGAFDLVSYQVPSDSGGGQPQNTYDMIHKVDYHFTDKTMITGRYALFNLSELPGAVNNSPYAGYDTPQTEFYNNAMVGVSHIWSPTLISDSRVLFNRLNLQQPLSPDQPVQPTLYMSSQSAGTVLGNFVYFPGYSATTPGNSIPFGGPQNVLEFSQGFSWSKGKQDVHFGGEYLYTRDNRTFGAYQNAVEALNGKGTVANVALLQAGTLGWFQVVIDPQGKFPCSKNAAGTMVTTADCTVTLPAEQPSFARSNRYNDMALYLQDNVKVLPRLTLNMGLRWEYYGVQHNSNPALDSNFVFGTGNDVINAIRNGRVYTVDATAFSPASPVGGLWKPQYHNFAPRLGFALDVFGNGKTSLRGGYGISYERNFGNVTFNVIQNPPAQFNYTVKGAAAGTITSDNLGPFAATSGTLALAPPSLRYVRQDIPTAYTNMWNLSIQQQIMPNTVFSLEYSGAHGVHLYSIENLNQASFGNTYLGTDPAVNPADRLNRQYGNMNTRGANGFSTYESLNANLTASNLYHKGLDIVANWTWSHSIDNLSSTFSETPQTENLGLLDPFQPALDKGNADFDARQRFALSAVWNVPFAKNTKGVMNQILDGWLVAPIFVARTGQPFTLFDSSQYTGDTVVARYVPSGPMSLATSTSKLATETFEGPNTFQYMALPAGNAFVDNLGLSGELPSCALTTNAAGHQVSTGKNCVWPSDMTRRNAFRAPGWYNFDLAVEKKFKVQERYIVSFRTEFFNVLNHSNYYVQGGSTNDWGNYNGSTTGPDATAFQIQGKRGVNPAGGIPNERRFIQMALRLTF